MLKHTLALALASASIAHAQDFKPAVVFDLGGKFDKSFNEGVWNGVQRFGAETGIEVAEFEVSNEAQRKQAIERMVNRGATAVLGIGFGQADALAEVAAANPDVQFGIIDVSWLDGANIKQYTFEEHEGSYLVGLVAAKTTKTGKVSFVGGMDIPLIRRFACGYAQGFKDGGGQEVFVNMTGTTAAAWNDPTKGGELARSQFDRGSDIVFAAAGSTGLGVLQAAKDQGKLAIGVDSNQNHLHPGTMLTSMLKRVDVAAYNFFSEAQANSGGAPVAAVYNLGLKDEGVGWAVDEHNSSMVEGFRKEIDQARDDIIAGGIQVHDYYSNNDCPHY